jgi:hypothetical protein
MATYYARKTGNINATDVWATTPTGTAGAVTFTSADILMSNSFTITINVNATVQEIRNDTTGGSTAGGTFNLNDGVTLTANLYGYSVSTLLLTSGTVSATLNGNLLSGSGSSGYMIGHGSSGTLTINGNISGNGNYAVQVNNSAATLNVNNGTLSPGTLSGAAYAIGMPSGGTLNINNCTVGSTTGSVAAILISSTTTCGITNSTINSYALNISGSSVVTITGSVTTTSSGTSISVSGGTLNLTGTLSNPVSAWALNQTGGTVTITGNVTASANHCIFISNGSLTVNGNVTGGGGGAANGINMANGSVTVNGNVNGGSGSISNTVGLCVYTSTPTLVSVTGTVTGGTLGAGLSNNFSATNITVNGTAVGGTGAPGIYNASNGSVTVTRAKGNGFGLGSGLTPQPGVQNISSGYIYLKEIEYGDLGQSPTSGPIVLLNATTNVCLVYRPGLSKKTLISADSTANLLPSASDVRSGTFYNYSNNVGTMNVPSASNVALGVSVGSTTGTAVLNVSDIWNVQTSNLGTSGSIGERLKNCSTVATAGQQLASALTTF